MKPLFTLHAGEYLVGSFIQEKYKEKGFKVWIPAKDEGIDLLITKKNFKKTVSLQVKYSKDHKVTPSLKPALVASGWWTLDKSKLQSSQANLWIFVLYSIIKKTQYVIIEPKILLSKLTKTYRDKQEFNPYFCVTQYDKCWEWRGLAKADQEEIAKGKYKNKDRDFSKYLNDWKQMENKLI